MPTRSPIHKIGGMLHPMNGEGSDLTRKLIAWLQHEQALSKEEALDVSSLVIPKIPSPPQPNEAAIDPSFWDSVKKVARFELGKQQKRMSQNFGLTEQRFDQMVRDLKAGDDQLFERIFLKHIEDCVKFIVRHYKANWEDAYDASMECLLEFHRRLRNGKITYGNLRFLFTRMAGQIYLKWIKKTSRQDPIDDQFDLAEPPDVIDPETQEALDVAWDQLGPDCQQVLKAFYYDGTSLKELAEKLQKTPAAIRKQKQRCLEKLRYFFNQL
jgi:RNA polymerase sigma factor (sigma-70 family)